MSWMLVSLCSAACFASVFKSLRRYPISPYQANCGMSVLHAMIIVVLATLAVQEKQGTSSTPLQAITLSVSLGYFMVDIFLCLLIPPVDKAAFVHHVACIAGQIASLNGGGYGQNLCLNLLSAEISTPFLYAFKTGLAGKGSFQEFICKGLFCSLFLTARFVYAPFLAKELFLSEASIVIKTSCVTILAVSALWACQIVSEIVAFFKTSQYSK